MIVLYLFILLCTLLFFYYFTIKIDSREDNLGIEKNGYESGNIGNIDEFKNLNGKLGDKIESKNEFIVQGHSVPLNKFISKNNNLDGLPVECTKKNVPRSMFIFGNNKISPSCCPSTFSTSTGCVCITDKQKNLLNVTRGNNRTSNLYEEI